jgi:glycosyltransferase involved in cell wall biosynthesis
LKILFVSEYYPPMHMGGAEISLRFLVEGLAKLGHEVTVLTPNYSSSRTEFEEPSENLRIIRFSSPRRYLFRSRVRGISSEVYRERKPFFYLQLGAYIRLSSMELRKKTRELLSREDFDLVHANNLESILALSWIKTRALKVAHLRDFGLICWNRGLNNRGTLCPGCSRENLRKCMGAGGFMAWLLTREIESRKRVLEEYDALVAISNFVKKGFLERTRIERPKIEVLYNPIGPDVVSDLSMEGARKLLGLPLEEKIVLFVGTLSEMKGAHLIPKIATLLPNVLFLVVGDGPLRSLFTGNIPRNLRYFGYRPVEEIRHFYRASDVVLVPSLWYEPFGRVVVEGIANGSFVVGSNRGAIPEVIDHFGCGSYTEPTPEKLASEIEKAPKGGCEKVDVSELTFPDYHERFLKLIR